MKNKVFITASLLLLAMITIAQVKKAEDFLYSKTGSTLLQQSGTGSGVINEPAFVYYNDSFAVLFIQKDTLLFRVSESGFFDENKEVYVIRCLNQKGDIVPALRLAINYNGGYRFNGKEIKQIDVGFTRNGVLGSLTDPISDIKKIPAILRFIDRKRKKLVVR